MSSKGDNQNDKFKSPKSSGQGADRVRIADILSEQKGLWNSKKNGLTDKNHFEVELSSNAGKIGNSQIFEPSL